jgi:predicted Ser/Thr protein kinase
VNQDCPRCGTRFATGRLEACPICLLEAEPPPALLGDGIELLEELGRGGMGRVYRARDLKLGRTVAVKFLPPELASRPDFRERLEREARALARLAHPNVVAVHDLRHEEGAPYIVMECVEGRPLSELVPLPLEGALDVALQVASALACAHSAGIVHRDVKPENVLVDDAGRVKVADFGIARLLVPGSESRLTSAGGVLGTPRYMAPEALAGSAPDPRMDVYSLGVLLHEMIAGRGEAGTESLPPTIRAIVSRATARAPDNRYESVEDMARDLTAARVAVHGLPAEENHWLWAVALLQTLAVAAGLWAFVVSVTPKVLAPAEVPPLVVVGAERLGDGRVVSRARFEVGPTLAALGMVVLALAGQGLLRRHWRESGLDRPAPEEPVPASRQVLLLGVASAVLYAVRKLLEALNVSAGMTYVPLLGGSLETAALFFVWVSILQARRTSRPLIRERALWLGLGLSLVPPVVELAAFVLRWRP